MRMDGTSPEIRRLRRNVEWALQRALDPGTVLPMLHRLSRIAADGSDDSLYAQRRLAELLAEHHPWRAALSARRVVAMQPADDGAWAILALCHALLGNYRCAAAAYRRALTLAPDNAAYAHNLGHLLDVALGRPKDALPWLRSAYELTFRRADVAVSFAHALGRTGDLAAARRVSRRALRARDAANIDEHLALARWLEEGAPDEPRLLPRRPPARVVRSPWKRVAPKRAPAGEARSPASPPDADALEAVLAKGLAKLPLDAKQRERARLLAHDASVRSAMLGEHLTRASVAAAIAYAIVFVNHVPLTQAEVAACFRVSVPALRGQFKALRARVDLSPGDARVATERPR